MSVPVPDSLTRLEVLEQNEWLDAMEEAEEIDRRKREREANQRAAPGGPQKVGRRGRRG